MTDLSDPGAAFMAAADGGEAPPASPPADAAPPAEPAAPAASPPAAAEEGDKAGEDRGPVPWGEHKKATDEAARYRTQLRAYEEAFSAWNPDDAQVLLQAVSVAGRLAAEGRTAEAAGVYREIAKVLGPEAAEAVADAVDEQADDDGDDELVTKADMERVLAEREEQREYEAGVQREMRAIREAADELGFDAQSEEWAEVLALAATFHDGDVRAAASALKAREQAAIDRYLESKKETARKTPRVASGSNPAPASEAPKDIDDASDKLRAFLDSQ